MIWSVCRSVLMLYTWSLKSSIYPNVTNSFPSVPHVETDRQRSITVGVVSTNAPPVRTDVSRTLPPLRTPSLEHLPSQADECKTLAYDLLELSQRPHWCNDLSLQNSDAVQWFFDINLKGYRNSINTKGWVKDVIQGFAQRRWAHRTSCT